MIRQTSYTHARFALAAFLFPPGDLVPDCKKQERKQKSSLLTVSSEILILPPFSLCVAQFVTSFLTFFGCCFSLLSNFLILPQMIMRTDRYSISASLTSCFFCACALPATTTLCQTFCQRGEQQPLPVVFFLYVLSMERERERENSLTERASSRTGKIYMKGKLRFFFLFLVACVLSQFFALAVCCVLFPVRCFSAELSGEGQQKRKRGTQAKGRTRTRYILSMNLSPVHRHPSLFGCPSFPFDWLFAKVY